MGGWATNRRTALSLASLFFVLTVALFLLNQRAKQNSADVQRSLEASHGNSGNQFLLEGKPVEARLEGVPDTLNVSDSFEPTLALKYIDVKDTQFLANEVGGTLIPELSVPGCQTNADQAPNKDTHQHIEAFVWRWNVICSSSGKRNLEIMLAFQPGSAPMGSDPLAYRYSQTILVRSGPSLEFITGILGVLTAIMTFFVSALPLFVRRRSNEA